jgi:hypothetical protein
MGTSCRRLVESDRGVIVIDALLQVQAMGILQTEQNFTRFGLRTIEKSIENPDVIFCSSFQNLRLGSIKLSNGGAVPYGGPALRLCMSWRR